MIMMDKKVISSNKRLILFALRYPWWIVLTTVLGFSGALFNGIGTTLVVPVILMFLGQQIQLDGLPPVVTKAFALLQSGPPNLVSYKLLGLVLGLIILKNISSYTSSLSSSHLTRCLTREIRQDGLRLLLDVDWNFYTSSRIGDIINRLGGETTSTASAIRTGVQLLVTSVTIVTFIGLLLAISWQLTCLATILLLGVAMANQFYIKRAKDYGLFLANQSRDYSVALLEMLTGMRLVKATANETGEFDKLNRLIYLREKADYQSQANSSLIGPINEVAGVLVVLVLVALSRVFFADQVQTQSTLLLTYLVLLFRMLPFVSQLNGLRNSFANMSPSVDVVNNFLRRDNKPFMPNGVKPFQGLSKGIRFNDLSFIYPGTENLVLDKISLNLPKGTTLALVGSSGSGKSTLADLLSRFYDPTGGGILIDGQDMREFDIHSLRKYMGIVSQDTFLFNASVRTNIVYACGEVTEEQVISAMKQANAYEFIVNLPQGLETMIGDRGVMLSGGQRQRLAIARALLRNPEILILDEATSALDTISERVVQEALELLSRDRTTLVIAHRLSTIRNADQIAVLSHGHVVEVGTHHELLALEGHYAKLHNLQASEEKRPSVVPPLSTEDLSAPVPVGT
jgi:ATP-binding cassette, subfamily B, bacterial MsbA